MLSVDELLDEEIRIEGGFVNKKADRGGPTKYGITIATLSKHLGHPASLDEVKGLSVDIAKEIMKTDYLFTPRIHTLPDALQPQLFDISINSGPNKAIEILQKVLNLAGFECSVDGQIGPATRTLAEQAYVAMGSQLINAISEYREHFYRSIVANNQSQSVFLDGWLNRARRFRVDE